MLNFMDLKPIISIPKIARIVALEMELVLRINVIVLAEKLGKAVLKVRLFFQFNLKKKWKKLLKKNLLDAEILPLEANQRYEFLINEWEWKHFYFDVPQRVQSLAFYHEKVSNQGRPVFFYSRGTFATFFAEREYYDVTPVQINNPNSERYLVLVYGGKMQRCNSTTAAITIIMNGGPLSTSSLSLTESIASTQFSIDPIPSVSSSSKFPLIGGIMIAVGIALCILGFITIFLKIKEKQKKNLSSNQIQFQEFKDETL